jgi:nitrite reductase/ring-hydroxylating ferredoxin subunit
VGALSDVPTGDAKAVKLGEGRGIALFNVDGKVYATDNQCPHMGYPARNQLLIGLSRWATDARKRAGSQSAAQTAQRFARGQTAVDLYES